MPTFHFEIEQRFTTEDSGGIELPSEQQAIMLAHEMAKQIAADVDDPLPSDLVVKTDNGEQIYRIAIKPK